jgi:hypothetical protein
VTGAPSRPPASWRRPPPGPHPELVRGGEEEVLRRRAREGALPLPRVARAGSSLRAARGIPRPHRGRAGSGRPAPSRTRPTWFRWFRECGGVSPVSLAEPISRNLSLSEREEISRGLAAEMSLRAIARQLGRHVATISREVDQNTSEGQQYRAVAAHVAAERRARRPQPRKLENPALHARHRRSGEALVTGGDRRPASAGLPRRCIDAGLPRNVGYLQVSRRAWQQEIGGNAASGQTSHRVAVHATPHP